MKWIKLYLYHGYYLRDSCMNCKKINLLNMDLDALLNFFSEIGERSFRAHQVMYWIYRRYCEDFDKMTNLSKVLRTKLNQIAEIRAPIIKTEKISIDGTVKWIMQVDDQYIETVYIPDKLRRATLCISSQIGCALGCSFCGTAQQGFNRNLRVSEIIGQIWRVGKLIFFHNKQACIKNPYIPITHVVFMGMGEPLLNLVNVVSSIKIILNSFGFGLSKYHVIVSTSGIVPGIDKLKDMVDIKLAVSLHAPNDFIRNKIMPINHKYNMNCLFDAIKRYLKKTTANRERITMEYVLLDNVNSEVKHAHELAKKLINMPCKVNLIPWNPIPNIQYERMTDTKIFVFCRILLSYGITTTIRKIRGIDINAACGQLIGKVINRIRRI